MCAMPHKPGLQRIPLSASSETFGAALPSSHASRSLQLAVVILLCGAFLRFFQLGAESIWIDEGFSAVFSKQPVLDILRNIKIDVHPPLYYILLHYWMELVSTSDVGIRAFSAVVGTIDIALIAVFARAVLGWRAAVISAFLLAFSTFHTYFSQEARMYSLVVMFGLLSCWSFWQSFLCAPGERSRRPLFLHVYVLSSIALIYTIYFGAFMLLAQGLSFLWYASDKTVRDRWPSFVVVMAILFAACLGLLPIAHAQMSSLPDADIMQELLPPVTIITVAKIVHNFSDSWLKTALYGVLGTIAFVALLHRDLVDRVRALGRHFDLPRDAVSRRGLVFCLLVFLVPVAAGYLVSVGWLPVMRVRSAIGSSVGLYVFLAAAIAAVRAPRVRAAILASILLLSGWDITFQHYIHQHKGDWRPAMSWLEATAGRGDAVVFNPGYHADYIYGFYRQRSDLKAFPFPGNDRDIRARIVLKRRYLPEMRAIADAYPVIWLVLTSPQQTSALLNYMLRSTHRLTMEKRFDRGPGVILIRKYVRIGSGN